MVPTAAAANARALGRIHSVKTATIRQIEVSQRTEPWSVYCAHQPFTVSRNNVMIRIAGAVLVLLALILVLCATGDALSLSIAATVTVVLLIIAFSIAATGWTIRRDN